MVTRLLCTYAVWSLSGIIWFFWKLQSLACHTCSIPAIKPFFYTTHKSIWAEFTVFETKNLDANKMKEIQRKHATTITAVPHLTQ